MSHVVIVAKGCPDIAAPESGRFVKMVFGTVLVVECNPGYILNGSPMLYCDKFEWNGTTPLCEGKSNDRHRIINLNQPAFSLLLQTIDGILNTVSDLSIKIGYLKGILRLIYSYYKALMHYVFDRSAILSTPSVVIGAIQHFSVPNQH